MSSIASFDTLRDAVNGELQDMHREVGKVLPLTAPGVLSPVLGPADGNGLISISQRGGEAHPC